jgi:phthiocerol/phenolphthiocerol synthesis type-I polyketide synthase C
VFSGNGSQWPGMGQAAYRANADFRDAFGEVDAFFKPLAGWSLKEEMFSPNLREDLPRASIAQPLLFAIQVASVRALAELGVRPSLVMGHSVGEVAAAEAAGILSLADAVKVIYHRSRHQELTENSGGMSVVLGPREAAEALVAEFPTLSVAAHNSHQCIVAAGPYSALESLAKAASKRKLRARQLDLAYPFHTAFMEPVRRPLIKDLADLSPSAGSAPFLSTISPGIMPGKSANALYWWRNVREKVLFHEGVEHAIELGKRVFLEIGPNGPLKGHVRDALESRDLAAFVDMALDDRSNELEGDPFQRAVTRLLAAGADVDAEASFGPDPGAGTDLPAYPWRRTSYRYGETTEATGRFNARARHPLIGARDNVESLEWRVNLDPDIEPALADHRVDGQTILPGAAFVEMALAVARDWKGDDQVSLSGFEILQPLIFAANVSREILCRVSASTATVEILSRPRLSKAAFALHARGGIVQKPGPAGAPVGTPEPVSSANDNIALYERARRCGLEFGPAYRQLDRAERTAVDSIEVDLTEETGDSRFGLDPARLDSCFHGLILLFDDLDSRINAYLPVRFDEVRLLKPSAELAHAHIRIRRRDARVIIADFDLFDAEGERVAMLRGARYQAMRGRADLGLAQAGLIRSWIPATAPLWGAGEEPGRHLNLLGAAGEGLPDAELASDGLLIEGWASAAAFELARALSDDGTVDLDELIVTGRLPAERRRWAESVFGALQTSGLILRQSGAYRISDQAMPSAEAIFRSLAAQHPHRSAEILLAAHVAATLGDFGRGAGALTGAPEAAREAFESRSPSAVAAAKALGAELEIMAKAGLRNAPALRILQIGHGAATAEILRFAAGRGAAVTLLDLDARRLERARISHGGAPETTFCGDLESLPNESFDLVVSAGGLSALSAKRGALGRLVEKCASNAAIVAVELAPSLFQDLVFGLDDDWFGDEGARLRSAEEWSALFARSGLGAAEAKLVATEADPAILIAAQAPAKAAKPGFSGEVVILREPREVDPFADALQEALSAGGAVCRFVRTKEIAKLKTEKTAKLLWLASEAKGDGVARVAAHCLALKELALRPNAGKLQILATVRGVDGPAAEAVFSFVRTLANEAPTIDFRRIGIAGESAEIAKRLAAFVLSNADETDIAIYDDGVKALRYHAPEIAPDLLGGPQALRSYRLEKGVDGGLDRLNWRPVLRAAPKAGEVEVEVAATGLNFRDVMWSLSVLPDEMLEDGFAGPTLGLEFSGRVSRVGAGVTNLRIGDEVVGFCGGSFSAHVTVDADHVASLPPTISCEAAATIPVAFLTAYYGLITCADLQRGEWVLIHGGAGGVGLAALQIAQWRGARAIVTAGSLEKRDLARALGAEYAFDSRSGAFVDEVMAATEGRGVAVVLNSLAGEAMERSIGLLEPFGRFVELGKRDYLANTPIGLRPFRRNLSYFGVDLDQLLKSRPDMSRRLFVEMLGLFSSGDLSPLPYSVFAHGEVVEAMRLMQQSGHIGKILVRPPKESPAAGAGKRAFSVNPNGTHLITGGLGGFGLAAAHWLIERGARHLVLVGRSGAASEEAREEVARMRSLGAEVLVEALDIADLKSSEQLFEKIAASMPPLAGVMHAAMVLDDAIVANMDEARLLKVLWPKIAGAEILNTLTRDMTLDYFVFFSSATTIIGNPGQGGYVAANGFLEGLARRRRQNGRPALAVAWGAISDVGVLSRKTGTREALAARSGVKGMDARTALNLMADALSLEGEASGGGVMVIADVNWSTARAHLPLLNSPTYKRLLNGEGAAAPSRNVVDLRELAARLAPDEAKREVANVIIEELARILRLPREDVSKTKPLSEIGLDSLMAVELALGLEERFALDAPLNGMAGGFNVMELAGQVLASVGQDENFVAEGLAAVHLDESERAEVGAFIDAMQENGADLRSGYSHQSAAG